MISKGISIAPFSALGIGSDEAYGISAGVKPMWNRVENITEIQSDLGYLTALAIDFILIHLIAASES